MLPEEIQLEIVTPAKQVLREKVESTEIPGKNGYLGILPGHAPLITELGIGQLSYSKGGETFFLTAMGGFAEVLPDRVIVLAEVSERAEEIDAQRAGTALGRAREQMAKPPADFDWDRAKLALERALIRVQVASKGGPAGGTADTSRAGH
ncbi:MAG: F0F1 ATP synthase subunit epsilon [Candidatus Acidiferrales bacterium]